MTLSASEPMIANQMSADSTKPWDEAVEKGWIVVSMKDDWKTIFPDGEMNFVSPNNKPTN